MQSAMPVEEVRSTSDIICLEIIEGAVYKMLFQYRYLFSFYIFGYLLNILYTSIEYNNFGKLVFALFATSVT